MLSYLFPDYFAESEDSDETQSLDGRPQRVSANVSQSDITFLSRGKHDIPDSVSVSSNLSGVDKTTDCDSSDTVAQNDLNPDERDEAKVSVALLHGVVYLGGADLPSVSRVCKRWNLISSKREWISRYVWCHGAPRSSSLGSNLQVWLTMCGANTATLHEKFRISMSSSALDKSNSSAENFNSKTSCNDIPSRKSSYTSGHISCGDPFALSDKLALDGGRVTRQFLGKISPTVEGEILQDIPRTFPWHPIFHEAFGAGQTILTNTLKYVAICNEDVGYCQGMNFVAAVFIVVLLDADDPVGMWKEDLVTKAYQVLHSNNEAHLPVGALLNTLIASPRFRMRGLWRKGVPELRMRIWQFDCLLRQRLPVLKGHFQYHNVSTDFFAAQWFITLFSYSLPLSILRRIWDIFFIDGWTALFRVGLSILQLERDKLLQMNLEEISVYFSHRRVKNTPLKDTYNHDLFFSVAASFTVCEAELEELESSFKSSEVREAIAAVTLGKPLPMNFREPVSVNASQSAAPEKKRILANCRDLVTRLELVARTDGLAFRAKIEAAERARKAAHSRFIKCDAKSRELKKELIKVQRLISALKCRMKKSKFSEDIPDVNHMQEATNLSTQCASIKKAHRSSLIHRQVAMLDLEEASEQKQSYVKQMITVLQQNEKVQNHEMSKIHSNVVSWGV